MQKVKTVYIDPNKISKHTKCQNISFVFSTPVNGVFLFARLCSYGVGMETKSMVTEWG